MSFHLRFLTNSEIGELADKAATFLSERGDRQYDRRRSLPSRASGAGREEPAP
jgi:hypothetical protein